MRRIAIEEHFSTVKNFSQSDLIAPQPQFDAVKSQKRSYKPGSPEVIARINDLTDLRLKEMDEAGIDMQVLGLGGLGPEIFDIPTGNRVAVQVNNAMYKVTKDYPKRFAAFAHIAPQDPQTAAGELQRSVEELGLVGLKLSSNLAGRNLDDEEYWPILAMAEKLDVPIYLHPAVPAGDLVKPFQKYPALTGSVWGYAVDCGFQAMRLICSGVFDKYPGLKIILGHLGEALPFWIWRIDNRWEKEEHNSNPKTLKLMRKPGDYIRDNFFVSTSGVFDTPPFMCAYSALGPDKILFAVDYPYESSKEAVQFVDATKIPDIDKTKIFHENAEKLLSI